MSLTFGMIVLVFLNAMMVAGSSAQSVGRADSTGSHVSSFDKEQIESGFSNTLSHSSSVDSVAATTNTSRLEYRALPIQTFKYDTSKNNPDHRCYEIIKPISSRYHFVFNLILMEKFTTGGAR